MRIKGLTAGRIAVLALITVLALGLAYLHFKPDPDPLTVPAGAMAGDLILEPGTFEGEDGPQAADIGTLVVPENRADPDSRLIALPVIRIKARSDNPGEPIFRLEGGPGHSNIDIPSASRFTENHDVVLVGYRGVDGSVVLDAPEVVSALRHSRDFLSEDSMKAYADAFASAAERYEAEGIDLAGYTIAQQIDDMEAARVALGYDRINLLSESAGTRVALIYTWRHPESIHRSVMIGVNPPGNFLWDTKAGDEQLERYSALYAKEAGSDKRTEDMAATVREANANMPERWGLLPIKPGNVRVASYLGMFETTTKGSPFTGPMILDAWLNAAEGDASGLWLSSLVAEVMFPRIFTWGEYAAIGRIDAQAAREYFSSGEPLNDNLARAATAFGWGEGRLADALPPDPDEEKYRHVQVSQVETLAINGELDVSTPPQITSEQLMPYLPNGHEVVLPGMGHTGTFWNYQIEAGTQLVNTFFDSGRVDDSLYHQGEVDFTPRFTFPEVAKMVAGSMVGLALVTFLSLVMMARRVRNRGRFGRVASALLRSVYPVVLGLGGWFLGALVVMTTMPGVPIDDELVVTLSVGTAIGLGVYVAWLNRDLNAGNKATGFAAAAGAALVGAWLGFNTVDGVLAVVTTIAGAILGANLALVTLDIVWERPVSTRFTEARAYLVLEDRPSLD